MVSTRVTENLVEIRNISKHYPGVDALKHISFDIRKNTVHCIVGENGAGKSTLIKILAGAVPRTHGEITFKGRPFAPRNTHEAIAGGLSFIFQELNVIDQFTVEENLSLGMETSWMGVIRRDEETVAKFRDILNRLEPCISLTERLGRLSVAHRQIVEIARALAVKAELIVMDEPTAALSDEEAQRLFGIIRRLKQENVTIVYISHRLDEIFAIGDVVTVFRDGEMVATTDLAAIHDKDQLIQLMLGKVVASQYVPSQADESERVMEVRDLVTHKLRSVTFDLFRGEILGFYGLIGAGKTEIARALYGLDRIRSGRIMVNGEEMKPGIPRDAIRRGVVMVPEERRQQGVFGLLAIKDNIPIMKPARFSRFGVTNSRKEREITEYYIRALGIATKGIGQEVATLSGGNQQKVVLGKCLNADPRILVLDEPTRGIDVGAKEEIHSIIRDLASRGNSIIVLSSELLEIVNLCDRIVLLCDGEVKRVLRNDAQLDTEEIMRVVTGIDSSSCPIDA